MGMMKPSPSQVIGRAGAEFFWLLTNGYNYKDLENNEDVRKECKAYVAEVMKERDEAHGR